MNIYKTIYKKSSLRSPTKKRFDIKSDNEWDDDMGGEQITCEDNHIYFYDNVNGKNILSLIKHIKNINIKLSALQSEFSIKYGTSVDFNIYLHINSSGGYVTDAFAALDHIEKSKFPIVSIVEGYAASAATFLSIVCSKRQITKTSSMLIHQLSGGCCGTYEQLEDDHENNKYLEDCIKKLYIKYTNRKLNSKLLEKVLKHDLMWNAEKCLRYGLVDEII